MAEELKFEGTVEEISGHLNKRKESYIKVRTDKGILNVSGETLEEAAKKLPIGSDIEAKYRESKWKDESGETRTSRWANGKNLVVKKTPKEKEQEKSKEEVPELEQEVLDKAESQEVEESKIGDDPTETRTSGQCPNCGAILGIRLLEAEG